MKDDLTNATLLPRNEGEGFVLARYRAYTKDSEMRRLGQRGADVFHAASSGDKGGVTLIAEFRRDPSDPDYDVRKDIAAGGLVRIKERAT